MQVTKGLIITNIAHANPAGAVSVGVRCVLANEGGTVVGDQGSDTISVSQKRLHELSKGSRSPWGSPDAAIEAALREATRTERRAGKVKRTITESIEDGKGKRTLEPRVVEEEGFVEEQVPRFTDIEFIRWE